MHRLRKWLLPLYVHALRHPLALIDLMQQQQQQQEDSALQAALVVGDKQHNARAPPTPATHLSCTKALSISATSALTHTHYYDRVMGLACGALGAWIGRRRKYTGCAKKVTTHRTFRTLLLPPSRFGWFGLLVFNGTFST